LLYSLKNHNSKMSRILSTFLITVLLKFPLFATGESGNVEGKIYDEETKEPLEFVSIAIYSEHDQELITGTISEQNGSFSIKGLDEGEYYIEVSFIGYEKRIVDKITVQENRTNVNLGEIILPRAVAQLNEVEIVAEELGVEYKIDRKVINVSQQLTAASGNAVDILENLPSITVDIEGNVALRGSTGFMVLIDGRPTVMESSEALQQIPANTIENIEIITNPSAKYNPDGTAGIINIVTKKNKLKGLSGTANLNLGNFERYGGGFLVNYTNDKWTAFFGADFNSSTRPGYEFNERVTQNNDTTFFTRSEGDELRKRYFWVLRGGLGYNISDKDFIDFEFNYGYGKYSNNTEQRFDEGIEPGGTLNNYLSYQDRSRGGNFYSINGSYRHDFTGKGHNLMAQFQYRTRQGEERTVNQLEELDGTISSGQFNTEDGPGTEIQLNMDYTRPFGEASKLETGYQARLGVSNDVTELYWYNPKNGDYELQPEFSNDTDYSRDIHSIYGIYAGESGKFGYQLGLRGEYTYRVIKALSVDQDFTIDRFDYFPTFHTSYKMPAEQQVMASYSRRIERPRGWYLEPFITFSDAFNVRQGNPGLLPEYIDAMELAYLKGLGDHSLSFEGYYRITNNKTERIRSVYTENVMLSRPENVGRDFALGGELVFSLNFFKWWKIDLSGNFYDYRLEGSLGEQVFDRQSFNWNSRFSNTFRFFEGNRIQLNSRYNSATVTAQGRREDYWTADIAVSQEFLKKKMTGILQVRDMFGRVIREDTSAGVDFYSYGQEYNDAPQVSLTINYRFNNYKSDQSRGGGGGGDDF
jgi:outer membrane receptor protein involved in Fe transport